MGLLTLMAFVRSSEAAPEDQRSEANTSSSESPSAPAPATEPEKAVPPGSAEEIAPEKPSEEAGEQAATPPSEPEDDSVATPNLTDTSVLTDGESLGEQDRRKQDKPATRWSEVGAFVGMVSRASSSSDFKYLPGVAYGGYFRPQITKNLGIRLMYREERIKVDAAPGAFDYGEEHQSLDLEQPKLKVTSLGLRIEPSFDITRHIQLLGVLSWSWVRLVAPMPEAEDFHQRSDRSGVELNWGLGGGVSAALLRNWLNLSLVGAYHFVSNQTGQAYKPIQAIVDGQMTHFAPIARPKNMVDVLFSVGLIL